MSEAAKQIDLIEPPKPARAVAKRDPKAAVAAPAPTTFLEAIVQAAANPAVDVDKFERLMAMQERVDARNAEAAFNEAMALAQADMEPVRTDATNPQTRSKYASYAALDRAIRPIYSRHGFGLSFNTESGAPADCVRVVCYVTRSGHTRKYEIDMPADGKGAKGGDVMTKTHAVGSGASYGQRYLLKLIFNIAVTSDDDGNMASNAPITEAQTSELLALIETVGADIEKFCAVFQIEGVALLPANKFAQAKKRLEDYGRRNKQ